MKNLLPKEAYKRSGVYFIRSPRLNKYYIGATILLQKRYRDHCRHLRKGIHANKSLLAHYQQYSDDLEMGLIEYCELEFLAEREAFYIEQYKKGYAVFNADKSEASKGRVFSSEHKQKIANALRGKPLSEARKAKISQKRKEYYARLKAEGLAHVLKQSEETRRKKSQALRATLQSLKNAGIPRVAWNKGIKMTDEQRIKISEARKLYYAKLKAAGIPISAPNKSKKDKG